MSFVKTAKFLCAAVLMTVLSPAISATDYPNKPVRFIVGFSPGSTIDAVARIVGEGLTKRLGVPVVVENRTGANGMIAARHVAASDPDGATILISNSSSITVNPLLFDDLQYDPLTDFEAISTIVSVPFVLAINPENPRMSAVSSLSDLVDLARAEPGRVTYGSAGNGNLMHLAGAQLATMSETEMMHIPYRGAAPMEAALLAQEIDYGFDTLSGVPLMKAGRLKPLAVSTKARWRELPDVPAVAELGYPDFDISFWAGVFAPAGTPQAIVDKLNKEIALVTETPEMKSKLELQGQIDVQKPSEFLERIKNELEQNQALIERANISIGD